MTKTMGRPIRPCSCASPRPAFFGGRMAATPPKAVQVNGQTCLLCTPSHSNNSRSNSMESWAVGGMCTSGNNNKVGAAERRQRQQRRLNWTAQTWSRRQWCCWCCWFVLLWPGSLWLFALSVCLEVGVAVAIETLKENVHFKDLCHRLSDQKEVFFIWSICFGVTMSPPDCYCWLLVVGCVFVYRLPNAWMSKNPMRATYAGLCCCCSFFFFGCTRSGVEWSIWCCSFGAPATCAYLCLPDIQIQILWPTHRYSHTH